MSEEEYTGRQAVELAEWDWLYSGTKWLTLHHVPLTEDQAAQLWDGLDNLVATCGRVLSSPRIPGWISRMSKNRCQRCCDRIGYPRGVGSPKNDEACRELVKTRLARMYPKV